MEVSDTKRRVEDCRHYDNGDCAVKYDMNRNMKCIGRPNCTYYADRV